MIRLFQWNSPLLSKSLFNNKYYLDFKSSKDPLEEYVKKMPKDLDWVNKVLCLEKRFFLSNHNLVYTDKMSMANSVEVRVPFLDDDLVNYVNNLPSSLKQNKFISKYLLKKAMEPFLPKEVIYRSKTGFKLPLRSWMENELGDYVMNVLSKENIKNREIFNFKKVQNLIDANYLGKIDASYTILSLVFIEIWFQIFLDKKPYKNLI